MVKRGRDVIFLELLLAAILKKGRRGVNPRTRHTTTHALAKLHSVGNYFPKKDRVPLSNFFSSSNMFFISLFLANT